MAIYRGPGGPGDATTDAASEAALVSTLVTQAQTAATNASNSANNANTSANSASTSATNAAASAGIAASNASLANGHRVNAAASASAAAASASAASTSATNAANSAQTSSNFAVAASMSYDSFDDRYLGAKATAPTVDNDGDPILTGALYWNTTTNTMSAWNGTAWAALSGGGSVTSVGMTVPTGLSVAGSPITTNGTLAVTYASGYAIPTTAKQSNWDDSYTFVSNFPTQTGNSGKYLTTNGSTLSWGTVTVTETDPVFVASAAYNITGTQISNWDTAYGWGNHASAGYLTSYTETDPVVGAINGIVKANGSGTISTATAGTDYLAPAAIGTTVQAYDSNLTSFVTTFTLPTTDGTAGQILQTNGSGTLSFVTNTGGSGISMGKAIAASIVFG
jgi:hypothetical protein